MNNTGHLHQCDLSVLIPFEAYLMHGKMPETTTNLTYMLNSHLLISFLGRVGLNNSYNLDTLLKKIKHLEDKWLMYHSKLPDEGKYA